MKMKSLTVKDTLKIQAHLTAMTTTTRKIIKGETEGPRTISSFQTLKLRDQAQELNNFLQERFGVLKLD